MLSEIVILAMLSNRAMHGYEIKKRVELVLNGSVSLNNKVLYPTLKRFEEMEAVEREVVRQDGKPDRHIYRITDHGQALLQDLLHTVSPEILSHEAEFLVRISFFSQIGPETRLEILRTRADIVSQKIAHIRQIRAMAQEAQADMFAEEVIYFHEQQDVRELEWIQDLMDRSL